MKGRGGQGRVVRRNRPVFTTVRTRLGEAGTSGSKDTRLASTQNGANVAHIADTVTATARACRGAERGADRARPSVGLALLRAGTSPPRCPASLTARVERPAIDYAALEAAIAHCDQVIRETRRRLATVP